MSPVLNQVERVTDLTDQRAAVGGVVAWAKHAAVVAIGRAVELGQHWEEAVSGCRTLDVLDGYAPAWSDISSPVRSNIVSYTDHRGSPEMTVSPIKKCTHANASLSTATAILIPERTDNLIIGICRVEVKVRLCRSRFEELKLPSLMLSRGPMSSDVATATLSSPLARTGCLCESVSKLWRDLDEVLKSVDSRLASQLRIAASR
ncbi:hypothetical protein MRB53_040192 [Persea americana]|nr:hypothetical protein MRB53_040192 [Persea americana]